MSKDRTPETPLTQDQCNLLDLPMDPKLVAEFGNTAPAHLRGNPYLPIDHAIMEANRIFGFGGWSCDIRELKCIGTHQNSKDYWVAKAECVMELTAGGAKRVAYGHGENQPAKVELDAVVNAKATAESNALKRCLENFGTVFGVKLRDKNDPLGTHQSNQRMPAPPEPERRPTMPPQQRPATKPRTEPAAQGTWGAQPEAPQPSKARLLDLVQEYLGLSQQIRGQSTAPPSIGRAFQSFQELQAVRDGDPNIAGFIAGVEADLSALQKEGL